MPRKARLLLLPALLWAGAAAAGASSFVVDRFDADTTANYVDQRWGTAQPAITWDNANDASTNHTSGSARWQISWPTTNDQIEATRALDNGTVLDLNQYANASFDLRFAANSATDGAGRFGALEMDAVPQSDGWPSTALGSFTASAAGGTNWVHVQLPLNVSGQSKLTAVTGIGLKLQQARTGSNLNGTTTFWIDNLVFDGLPAPGEFAAPQLVQLNAARTWQRLEFAVTNVPTGANPFDPESIRLDATFTLPSGKTQSAPAFWYQDYTRSLSGGTELDAENGPPQWRLRMTPSEPGDYSLSLTIRTNGWLMATVATNFNVVSNIAPARFGYVSVAPGKQYFQTGDGRALPLIGENVAWPNSRKTYDYDNYFSAMRVAGENFVRVWMCPWSFGIEDAPGTLTNYSLLPAWQLDHVLQQAEANGIYLQLTLMYHGMFEVKPDYWGGGNYWPQNPYNATNGGPCVNQMAFFTNSTAIVTYQKRLRYLIGRYGYSQNLFAWELFNEIDNEYAYLNPTAVANWHGVLANWLHLNDSNRHLVTTSLTSAKSHPEMWNVSTLDFSSEHAYTMSASPLSVAGDARYFQQTFGKPVVIGEFGTDWRGWNYNNSDPYLRGYRQGLWAGALGGSAGSSMAWWWDHFPDYSAYSTMNQILGQTDWGKGAWASIGFQSSPTVDAIGIKGVLQSLIYVVAADADFPGGATNSALPLQHAQAVTLNNWPDGHYFARWYDPATGSNWGTAQAVANQGALTLSLPDFTVDVAGVIYAAPTLTASNLNSQGAFEFKLNAGAGGIYTIEKSSDLEHWSSWLTLTNSQGNTLVSDAELTSSTAFYRVRQQN